MTEDLKKTDGVGGGLLREDVSHLDLDKMRSYIATVAWSMQDEKLLRMLYIRAKTIKNM